MEANNREKQVQRRALRAVLEWLTSDDYKDEARWNVVRGTFTVWNTVRDVDYLYVHLLKEEKLQQWQTWKETEDALKNSSWFRGEWRTLGRPRTRDFSPKQERAAQRREEQYGWVVSERAAKDLRRVAGESQRGSEWVVTLTDNVWRDLLKQTDPETLEGRTRDELATLLKVNRKVTNSFVRYLLSNGWRESKVRTPEGRKTVLKKDTV